MPFVYPGLVWLLAALPLDRQARPSLPCVDRLARLADDRRDRLPRRLPHRPQRAGLERDRRRLLGGDRRSAHRDRPAAVRELPDRGQPARLRPRRLLRRDPRAHPDQRPLRVGRRPGRHLRAGVLRGLPAGVLGLRLEREVGHPARGPRDLDRVGSALPARDVARRPALRWGEARRDARVRLGRLAVHAVLVELEHERHDPARAARSVASTS